MRRRKPQRAAGAFVRGATDGPRIGSTEQLAKGSIRRSGDSHRRLPPEVSALRHFHRLASPATFPPTECLMAPASYLPHGVRCDDECRTRTSVPGKAIAVGRIRITDAGRRWLEDAGSRGSDPRPLGPTMGGRPDRTCGERPRAPRIATRPKVGPTNCEKNISPLHGVEIVVGAERWTAISTWGD
jgi:hypothetical protein